MPWCPKCKCEYEEGVVQCADCDVELVAREEDIVIWQPLVKAKQQEDADELIKYLNYSGIEQVQQDIVEEDNESYIQLSVLLEDVKKAKKCLQGYMMNKLAEKQEAEEEIEDEEEEELVNEYETEEFGDDTLVKDLKSSTYTFGFVGVALIIASVLSFTDIIKITFSDKYLFSGLMLVIGIAFIGIAINSGKRVGSEAAHIADRDRSISDMLTWFENKYNIGTYLTEAEWYEEGIDEGAIYYKMMDQLKAVMSKSFPNHDQKTINSAAEIVFEKMMSK